MLWWLTFWTALGLCVGSFLNAVIYRLPRHGSLRIPRWSACPACRHRIAWFDNLPIVSFLLLRGRCRRCGVPIATRYMVIEAAMAIIVLVLLDAFFISDARAGLSRSPFGLTDELTFDWPIFLAHVILFACLLCMSAIDLEHYWVDVRFTNFAVLLGFVLHTLWTPPHSREWIRPGDATAVVALFAVFGLAIVHIVRAYWTVHAVEATPEEPAEDPSAGEPAPEAQPASRPNPFQAPSRGFAWAACLLLFGLFVGLATVARSPNPGKPNARGLLPVLLFFALILRESTIARSSDEEIVAAIEEERSSARATALRELALLLPAVALGVLGLALMLRGGDVAERMSDVLHARIPLPGLSLLRNWTPLWGLGTAAAGFVITGAVGWTVRILFTLWFGKEAFGTGDIHLMAAAGCVAGWPVAVLGFILASVLALIGWLLVLPFKRTRALPLGPWLSLSFFIVVIFYEPLVHSSLIRQMIETAQYLLT